MLPTTWISCVVKRLDPSLRSERLTVRTKPFCWQTSPSLDSERPSGLATSSEAGCLRLDSNQVKLVNHGLGGAGDTPWAGAKQSGFGFLGSPDGYRQFTRPRSIFWTEEPA